MYLEGLFSGKIQVEAGIYEYEACFAFMSSIKKQRLNARVIDSFSVQKDWDTRAKNLQ